MEAGQVALSCCRPSAWRRRAAAHARFIIGVVLSRLRPGSRRRGPQRQLPRRRQEAHLHRRARAFLCWSRWLGRGAAQVAADLGINERTLRNWLQARGDDPPRLRGRPLCVLDPDERNQVIAAIMLMGGAACSVAALQEGFPGIPRRALEECLNRFRHAWHRRAKRLVHVLRWRRPGSVWALDHSHAPSPVDGRFPVLLNVRDLASGCTLLSLPSHGETSAETAAALAALFLEHGPPLVLKSDNGGAFTGPETAELCRRHRVTQLFNPVRTPAYNGACEAGNGAIKTRAHHFAARRDQPGRWTCDDVESARLQANADHRPLGPNGPAAQALFDHRLHPNADERHAFLRHLQRYRERTVEEWSRHADGSTSHNRTPTPAQTERTAIARALVACDLLTYHRRRISPPGKHRISAKIS